MTKSDLPTGEQLAELERYAETFQWKAYWQLLGELSDGLIRAAKERERMAAQYGEITELVLPNDPGDTHAELIKELKAWDAHSDANLRNLERVSVLRAERDALRELLRRVFPLAMDGIPKRGHEGSCGPESGCDGICMEVAHCAELLREVRNVI